MTGGYSYVDRVNTSPSVFPSLRASLIQYCSEHACSGAFSNYPKDFDEVRVKRSDVRV